MRNKTILLTDVMAEAFARTNGFRGPLGLIGRAGSDCDFIALAGIL
jgi:hypothetical protein